MVFWGMWFRTNQILGDTVEAVLNKMMMTDQHQHSDRLLQDLDLAAGKVRLQSREALGSNEEERGRLLIDRLL